MADISKITLPSGTTYDIKDAVARQIAAGALQFRGVTTTEITDLSTTTSYVVNGETLTAANGDLVIYEKKEFVYTTADNKWHELGDNSAFKALAYKDSASGTYTPAGTVSQPTFTGSSMTATGSFTPEGSVSLTKAKSTVTPASSGSATYTPTGTVTAPTISVSSAGSTATIHNPTKATVATAVVAAAPSASAPSNAITYYDVSNETLSLYQIGYNTGDSITTSDVTVKTGDAAYEATAPSFSGTGVRLETDTEVPSAASFSGTSGSVSVSGTPEGTVSQPTFSGTQATITVS